MHSSKSLVPWLQAFKNNCAASSSRPLPSHSMPCAHSWTIGLLGSISNDIGFRAQLSAYLQLSGSSAKRKLGQKCSRCFVVKVQVARRATSFRTNAQRDPEQPSFLKN